jgi:hypothetical protein
VVPFGSKALFGLAVLTFIGGVGVGATNGDKTATIVLCFIGAAAFALAIAAALADSDQAPWVAPDAPWAEQQPVGGRPAKASVWPIAGAFAFALLAGALAGNAIMMIAAVVVLTVVGGGWLLQHWSEQPTYSPQFAGRLRERVLLPFGIPVGVMLLVAIIAISLSRIWLALPENGTRAVALAVALVILIGAFAIAASERMARTALIALSSFALVALIGAGLAGLVHGAHKVEKPKLVNHFAPLPGEAAPTTTVAPSGTTTSTTVAPTTSSTVATSGTTTSTTVAPTTSTTAP